MEIKMFTFAALRRIHYSHFRIDSQIVIVNRSKTHPKKMCLVVVAES